MCIYICIHTYLYMTTKSAARFEKISHVKTS